MTSFFRKALPYFGFGGVIFLLFVFFSYLVHKDLFTQFDFDLTVRLQDRMPRRFDELFSFLSVIGRFEFVTVVLVIVLLIKRVWWGIVAFFLYGAFHIFELYGKIFVEHFPPPHFMLRTKHAIDFPQFYVRSEYSYPSGHSGRAVFLTVILGILIWHSKKLNKNTKIVLIAMLFFYDVLMGVSRVYLGEHWSSDVIGGMLLGLALGVVASL